MRLLFYPRLFARVKANHPVPVPQPPRNGCISGQRHRDICGLQGRRSGPVTGIDQPYVDRSLDHRDVGGRTTSAHIEDRAHRANHGEVGQDAKRAIRILPDLEEHFASQQPDGPIGFGVVNLYRRLGVQDHHRPVRQWKRGLLPHSRGMDQRTGCQGEPDPGQAHDRDRGGGRPDGAATSPTGGVTRLLAGDRARRMDCHDVVLIATRVGQCDQRIHIHARRRLANLARNRSHRQIFEHMLRRSREPGRKLLAIGAGEFGRLDTHEP